MLGLVEAGALLKAVSAAEPGRKGLVEGVGREVFDMVFAPMLAMAPGVDIREGKVPARPRRAGLLIPVSVNGTRSGKPSWFGLSGISNKGVEVPLVGGPQIFGERPLADCSSRVRLGKSLEVWSCRGEPAPILALDRPESPVGVPFAPENGDLLVGGFDGSIGGKDARLRFSGCSGRDWRPMLSTVGW